jgi:hypothetical protein
MMIILNYLKHTIMIKKKLIFISFLLLSFGLTTIYAQNLYIRDKAGNQTAIAISNINKITFSGEDIVINQIGESENNFDLTNIRYINFIDLDTAATINNVISEKSTLLMLYPNPVHDLININFTNPNSQTAKIEILSLNGNIIYVEQLKLTNEENTYQFSVSMLQRGAYLCRIITEKTVTTTKFLKD